MIRSTWDQNDCAIMVLIAALSSLIAAQRPLCLTEVNNIKVETSFLSFLEKLRLIELLKMETNVKLVSWTT